MAAETFPKKPWNFIITLDRHFGLFLMFVPPLPLPICPGMAWHIGFAVENMSRFGLGTDKWNDDVLVDGVPICSRGNSAWPIAPHWNLFPAPGIPVNPNLLMPILIILSTSKNFMAVGSVVAKQGPIAVSIPVVKYIGTNLACNDPVPLPTDIVIHTGSTVVLGFTLGDLLAALLTWAIDIAVALLLKVLGKVAGAVGRKIAGKIAPALTRRFSSGVLNKVGNALQKFGNPTAKGPPGLLKRLNLNALGKANANKVYNTPKLSALDDFFSAGWMDKFLKGKGFPVKLGPSAGQFQSIAEKLGQYETKGALKAIEPLRKAAQERGLEWLGFDPPGQNPTTPSLPDRLGSWVDGNSEMISGTP